MSKCKCTMAQSVTGDGCRYCQPQEYIDRLEEWLDDERQQLEQAQEKLENYEALKRMHRLESYPNELAARGWILRKQAEAVEAAVYELTPGHFGPPDDPSQEFIAACEMCAEFSGYAQRLRQQADEAERAGGEK